MPISSFGKGLQKVLSFLPGTYGTSLVRDHSMRGAFSEMQAHGVPETTTEIMKDALDCNFYFFADKVETPVKYAVLAAATAALIGIYILLNTLKKNRN